MIEAQGPYIFPAEALMCVRALVWYKTDKLTVISSTASREAFYDVTIMSSAITRSDARRSTVNVGKMT